LLQEGNSSYRKEIPVAGRKFIFENSDRKYLKYPQEVRKKITPCVQVLLLLALSAKTIQPTKK
jgi:hypothetical protein